MEGYDESRTGFVTIAPAAAAAINAGLDRFGVAGARVSTGDFPTTTRYGTAFARIDARVGTAAQTTFRYSLYDVESTNARTAGGLNDVSRGTSLDNADHTAAWTWQAALGSGLVTDVRAQYVHSRLEAPANDLIGPAINISRRGELGHRDVVADRPPEPPHRGGRKRRRRARPAPRRGRDRRARQSGPHRFPGAVQGSYTFASLANLELGRSSTSSRRSAGLAVAVDPNLGIYVQDEWRLAPSVTVSAGLRYDLQWLAAPVETDFGTLSPRLGLAWPPGDRRTVVRASAGRYLDRLPLRALSNALQRDGSKYRTAVLSFGQAGRRASPTCGRPPPPARCRA